MLLDELVLALDALARDFLLGRKVVLDHLEDEGIGRQVEHQHHHALDARRNAELVAGMAQVEQEVAVEQVLAVLLQANGVVQLGARLARHQRTQKLHIGRGHGHVDHEISPREAEQGQQVVFTEQGRIDVEATLGVVQDGDGKRQAAKTIDHLAHDVRAFVAVEQRGQHLDLEIGAQANMPDLLDERLVHELDVALEVIERHAQLVIDHNLLEHAQQVLACRVVGAERPVTIGLVVVDVLGGHRRPHEDEIVAVVLAIKDLDGHRVEEGFGQLGLTVTGEQADVEQLDLVPDLHGEGAGPEIVVQPLDRLLDPQVVELDADALRGLLPVPVGFFKASFGLRAGFAEDLVVAIKPIQQGPRDLEHARVGQLLGKHGVAVHRQPHWGNRAATSVA